MLLPRVILLNPFFCLVSFPDRAISSTLKKETLRIKRRGKSQIFPGFKIVWLLKQCKYELHYHLRDLGWYFEQNKPLLLGSEAWFESVQNKFCQIVQNSCDIVDERLYLRQSIKDSTAITRKTTIICEIIKTLEIDGGTHLSHSLLMHRYPHLRALLSGYDLRQLLDDDHEFLEVSIRNQEIFFNLRQDDYSSEKRALLQVDETGLFSVTSSKYAKAFANFLLRYASDSTSVAVDLTASVGGLTLALAKQPRISHVIAIEIDPHRSELCRQNMQIHNASHKVEVRTQDSYQILAELSQELKEEQEIIMALDPPWGGIHYKENPQMIQLGPWSLVQVLKRISESFNSSILGIRLPVAYDVPTLYDSLENDNVSFEPLQVKKVGPQLFVFLRL